MDRSAFACVALIVLVIALITSSRSRPVVQRAQVIQNFTGNDQRSSGIGARPGQR